MPVEDTSLHLGAGSLPARGSFWQWSSCTPCSDTCKSRGQQSVNTATPVALPSPGLAQGSVQNGTCASDSLPFPGVYVSLSWSALTGSREAAYPPGTGTAARTTAPRRTAAGGPPPAARGTPARRSRRPPPGPSQLGTRRCVCTPAVRRTLCTAAKGNPAMHADVESGGKQGHDLTLPKTPCTHARIHYPLTYPPTHPRKQTEN